MIEKKSRLRRGLFVNNLELFVSRLWDEILTPLKLLEALL